MSQSLANLLIHVVFSTKHRDPRLRPEIREQLVSYVVTVLRNHGSDSLQIGGVEDHVHILLRLSRTMTVAEAVEKMKTTSTKWIRETWQDQSEFAWQGGYGASSVSPSDADGVIRYIRSQEAHHRKATFQDEYRALLREAGIDFDERYVWD